MAEDTKTPKTDKAAEKVAAEKAAAEAVLAAEKAAVEAAAEAAVEVAAQAAERKAPKIVIADSPMNVDPTPGLSARTLAEQQRGRETLVRR